MDYYLIGGSCSLCGAYGTNKTTCPFNPNAKKKDPAKHNPTMKKDAKPKPTSKIVAKYKTQSVNIVVSLLNDAKDGPTLYTKKQAQQIIDWYNKRMASEYFTTYVSDFTIEYVNKKIFHVSYKPLGDIYLEQIIDPDDDGNYPITINGREYIVMGGVLK